MPGRVIRETRGTAASATTCCSRPTSSRGRTTAELDPADKDAISHRGRALREIAPVVGEVLARSGAAG